MFCFYCLDFANQDDKQRIKLRRCLGQQFHYRSNIKRSFITQWDNFRPVSDSQRYCRLSRCNNSLGIAPLLKETLLRRSWAQHLLVCGPVSRQKPLVRSARHAMRSPKHTFSRTIKVEIKSVTQQLNNCSSKRGEIHAEPSSTASLRNSRSSFYSRLTRGSGSPIPLVDMASRAATQCALRWVFSFVHLNSRPMKYNACSLPGDRYLHASPNLCGCLSPQTWPIFRKWDILGRSHLVCTPRFHLSALRTYMNSPPFPARR